MEVSAGPSASIDGDGLSLYTTAPELPGNNNALETREEIVKENPDEENIPTEQG